MTSEEGRDGRRESCDNHTSRVCLTDKREASISLTRKGHQRKVSGKLKFTLDTKGFNERMILKKLLTFDSV